MKKHLIWMLGLSGALLTAGCGGREEEAADPAPLEDGVSQPAADPVAPGVPEVPEEEDPAQPPLDSQAPLDEAGEEPRNDGAAEAPNYVGMTLEEAEAAADARGLRHRVVEVDGEPRPVTMDYLEDRLNFSVADGVVIAVTNG